MKDYVTRLCPHNETKDTPSHFVIETATGQIIESECCIISTGACQPNIPSWTDKCTCTVHSEHLSISSFIESPPHPSVGPDQTRNILVVGGGQTAAQLADIISNNPQFYNKLVMVHRRKIRASHFDVSLDWLGRYNTQSMARFRQSDAKERLDILRKATNGGSVQPDLCARIKSKAQDEATRFVVCEGVKR